MIGYSFVFVLNLYWIMGALVLITGAVGLFLWSRKKN